MLIQFAGRTLAYDRGEIDIEAAVAVETWMGCDGLEPWYDACSAGQSKAIQALMWVVLNANGDAIPEISATRGSRTKFMDAMAAAIRVEDAAAPASPKGSRATARSGRRASSKAP